MILSCKLLTKKLNTVISRPMNSLKLYSSNSEENKFTMKRHQAWALKHKHSMMLSTKDSRQNRLSCPLWILKHLRWRLLQLDQLWKLRYPTLKFRHNCLSWSNNSLLDVICKHQLSLKSRILKTSVKQDLPKQNNKPTQVLPQGQTNRSQSTWSVRLKRFLQQSLRSQ